MLAQNRQFTTDGATEYDEGFKIVCSFGRLRVPGEESFEILFGHLLAVKANGIQGNQISRQVVASIQQIALCLAGTTPPPVHGQFRS